MTWLMATAEKQCWCKHSQTVHFGVSYMSLQYVAVYRVNAGVLPFHEKSNLKLLVLCCFLSN